MVEEQSSNRMDKEWVQVRLAACSGPECAGTVGMGRVWRNLGVGWWGQDVKGAPALPLIFLCEVGRIKKQPCLFTGTPKTG